MNIYIIRHGDPDYEHDTLTPKGWREAELVSRRLCRLPVKACYVSPLGRARDTASCTLKKLNMEGETLPWLREFNAGYATPREFHPNGLGWDLLPESWVSDPRYYDPWHWMEAPAYSGSGIGEKYKEAIDGLDALLERHGYRRQGNLYEVVRPNKDNLLFFCHYGVECVLLSRLLDCSPVTFWHHSVALTTSVTVLTTEERRPGKAVWRMSRFGDLSHLDAAGEEPSFSGRFCEVYGDGTRVD